MSAHSGLKYVDWGLDRVQEGAWFNYGDTRLGQGREQSKEFLRTNQDIAQQLETQIRAKVADIDVPVEGIKEAE